MNTSRRGDHAIQTKENVKSTSVHCKVDKPQQPPPETRTSHSIISVRTSPEFGIKNTVRDIRSEKPQSRTIYWNN